MFHQIVQSVIDKGRLKFVETHIYDQSILISPDGQKLLHWLTQADSSNDEKVQVEDGVIKSSSEEIIHEQTKDSLEDEDSIDSTTKTSSIGGN
jgi:hypothetical protein